MCEKCRQNGDDDMDHSEMRDMLSMMLRSEEKNHRMVTLRMSVIAAPVLAELLRLGLSVFSSTNSDLEKADNVDANFAKMAAASAALDIVKLANPAQYDRLLATAPSDVRTYVALPPDERDMARKAHKAMTLLSLAEVATFPEEVESEVTRIMAETGTVTQYHMPPAAVEHIDEYVEAWRQQVAQDADEVRVLLIGRPEQVKEFATKHNLNPDDLIDTSDEATHD